MDHAEARAGIVDAVAAPGGLVTLVADPSPQAVAIREHVRGCSPCAREWRAWSVVATGLATAAPEQLAMRTDARQAVLDGVLSTARRPLAGSPSARPPGGLADAWDAADAPSALPSIVPGGRDRGRKSQLPAPGRMARRDQATQRDGSWFRWLAVGAAALVLVFVAGAAFGRPLGLGGGEPDRTGDLPRVMAVTASILEGQGYGLAQLQTPDGRPGGFVAVSPGSGQLVVATEALAPPPEGVRYVCLLDRDGTQTRVGAMRFDGNLAYWAGPVADPVDIGLSGDRFLVQLDAPGSEPALTGTF